MSCGCDRYFDKNFEDCFKCSELCRNGGKDCARLCPCHNIMQELYTKTSNFLRQNSLLQTQNEDLKREKDLWLGLFITLACVLFAILVICAAAYWYYRRYCNEANVIKGQPKQAEDNGAKEKQVIVGVSTPYTNGVSANDTAEGGGEEAARQTLLKTSYFDDGVDSRQTQSTLMMPEQ